MLAEAGARPLRQRQEGAEGALGGGVEPGLGQADPHRRAVGVAGQHELAARGHDRQVGGRPLGLRPVAAERRERHGHERRVLGPQAGQGRGVDRRVEAGRAAFDQHVGRGGQPLQLGDRCRRPPSACPGSMPSGPARPAARPTRRAARPARRPRRAAPGRSRPGRSGRRSDPGPGTARAWPDHDAWPSRRTRGDQDLEGLPGIRVLHTEDLGPGSATGASTADVVADADDPAAGDHRSAADVTPTRVRRR